MTSLCPHCGFDLKQDEPIIDGDWAIDPRGSVAYQGRDIPLTGQEARIFFAIAKAGGRPITRWVIAERLFPDAESLNLVAAHKTRIEAKLRNLGIPIPYVNIWGVGLAWQPPISAVAA